MFWKDLLAELRAPDLLPILVGFSVLTALSGPFGSYAVFGFPERLAFWFPVISLGSIAFLAFRLWVVHQFPKAQGSLATVIATISFAVLSAPGLGLLFRSVFGPYFGTLAGWGEIGTLVYLISLGLCLLRHPSDLGHLESQRVPEIKTQDRLPQDEGPQVPRLLARLPPDQRGQIESLEVDDHYVVVTTEKGRFSLLMRLSDAIAETVPEQGAQVHRSIWVSWAAVSAAEREKGRWYVRLHRGQRLPVSRANVEKLAQRGLI